MTHKIIPHIWFDKEARLATALYASVFPDSKIDHIATITGTPSGDCDIVTFTLASQKFMAMSAGPYFKLNPAISFFTVFDKEADIEKAWEALVKDGKILMPYATYPWAEKYGWLQDKFGMSWQFSMSEHHKPEQKISPLLMFTKEHAGKAKEAMDYYTSLFPDSKIDMSVPYGKGDNDMEGFIKHARFTLNGLGFMAMDSSAAHDFTFNEALSLIVTCDTQKEIDHYWEKLSAVPEAEQCGWLKDKYGVSWQIVPSAMNEMMTKGSKEQGTRVTKAFMTMKKFDIEKLEDAFEDR